MDHQGFPRDRLVYQVDTRERERDRKERERERKRERENR